MEDTIAEFEIEVEQINYAKILKEEAFKSAAGAIITVAVTLGAKYLANKAIKKFNEKKKQQAVVETTATEV